MSYRTPAERFLATLAAACILGAALLAVACVRAVMWVVR